METNADHLYIKYIRGGLKFILSGRQRREIDFSGAVITPAQPNRIRPRVLLQGNSFIDDLKHNF